MNFKNRMILGAIISGITFILLMIGDIPLKWNLLILFTIYGTLLIITDPDFIRQQKERRKRMEYERDIARDEYVRERARSRARDDFQSEKNYFNNTFSDSIFLNNSKKKKK